MLLKYYTSPVNLSMRKIKKCNSICSYFFLNKTLLPNPTIDGKISKITKNTKLIGFTNTV